MVVVPLCAPLGGQSQSGLEIPVAPPAATTFPNAFGEVEDRPVSWKLLAPNILCDQKPIWTFPYTATKGGHWKPTLAVVAATAGLVALDPSDTPYFRRTTAFNQFNKVCSGTNMAVATAVGPLSLYAVSLVRKDAYGQHTSLLAGEAVADAEVLTPVMKNIDRRLRPIDIRPNGNFSDTWFRSHGNSDRRPG